MLLESATSEVFSLFVYYPTLSASQVSRHDFGYPGLPRQQGSPATAALGIEAHELPRLAALELGRSCARYRAHRAPLQIGNGLKTNGGRCGYGRNGRSRRLGDALLIAVGRALVRIHFKYHGSLVVLLGHLFNALPRQICQGREILGRSATRSQSDASWLVEATAPLVGRSPTTSASPDRGLSFRIEALPYYL